MNTYRMRYCPQCATGQVPSWLIWTPPFDISRTTLRDNPQPIVGWSGDFSRDQWRDGVMRMEGEMLVETRTSLCS